MENFLYNLQWQAINFDLKFQYTSQSLYFKIYQQFQNTSQSSYFQIVVTDVPTFKYVNLNIALQT